MRRQQQRSTLDRSPAASELYKRQLPTRPVRHCQGSGLLLHFDPVPDAAGGGHQGGSRRQPPAGLAAGSAARPRSRSGASLLRPERHGTRRAVAAVAGGLSRGRHRLRALLGAARLRMLQCKAALGSRFSISEPFFPYRGFLKQWVYNA